MKEALQQQLTDNHKTQRALPGHFSLQSGKAFTYSPRLLANESYLRVERFYRVGERFDDLGNLEINLDGTVRYFSFSSFSGDKAIELNETRIYLMDCAELLTSEFAAKIAADYEAKKDEFDSLFKSEKAIRDELGKIEQSERRARTEAHKKEIGKCAHMGAFEK